MNKNIGPIDGIIRTDLAFVLAYFYFTNPDHSAWCVVGLILAGHLLATVVVGMAPEYKLFGISTMPKTKKDPKCESCEDSKNGTC